MSLEVLYSTPTIYDLYGGEWDEMFESFTYLYDDEDNRFVSRRKHGRHNLRRPNENYEESEEEVIPKTDLPKEALMELEHITSGSNWTA